MSNKDELTNECKAIADRIAEQFPSTKTVLSWPEGRAFVTYGGIVLFYVAEDQLQAVINKANGKEEEFPCRVKAMLLGAEKYLEDILANSERG